MGGGFLVEAIESHVASGGGGGLEAWRLALILASLPTFALALAFAATFTEPARRREAPLISERSATSIRSMVPFFLPLVVGAGAPMIIAAGYAAWAPETLKTEYGLSLRAAGAWFGIVALQPGRSSDRCFFRNWFAGRKIDPLSMHCCASARSLFVLGMTIFIAAPLQPQPAILLIGYLFGAILMFGAYSTVIVSMQYIAPQRFRATLVASTTFIGSGIGLSVGPPLVAVLKERIVGTYSDALAWTAVLAGLISLAALLIARRASRELWVLAFAGPGDICLRRILCQRRSSSPVRSRSASCSTISPTR